ncbi:MAG: hypothetical protein COU11_01275 [Candidatus Harrisonbacteria bacterium CG10_big_fil_rev_8_21_14_0_10_49_15]|uniref:HAD family phosphatase n=1 Tax=Candidatus Harrisonbacteria bacterium CG10_big_fil_rev_8_21_14_0_10_49_15 TaxID=1974587 RepID=A0A2H0ULL7_9BACT|nr:MAG: hypothetical protein COU11_01275 [Candidatus Harrisonbacteria bacterium CG10_big_fil_rev_8_21_14_0_10_49_15]
MKNQIKIALFDVDGIVIVGREKYFSHVFADENNLPREVVDEFFLNDFKLCTFGRADLKEKIAPYLSRWKWQGDVDGFLEKWFKSEALKDEAVLDIVGALRSKGIKCYLATRQEKYRLAYIWNTVGLKNNFDGFFGTCEIGYDKCQPEFFERVFEETNSKADEILFFDDAQKNIDMAKSLGIQAHFYSDIEVLKTETASLLK